MTEIGLIIFCGVAVIVAVGLRVCVLRDYKRMPRTRHVSLRLRQRDFLRAMREREEVEDGE